MTLAVAIRGETGLIVAADRRMLEEDGTIHEVGKVYEIGKVTYVPCGDGAQTAKFVKKVSELTDLDGFEDFDDAMAVLDLCLQMKESKGSFSVLVVDDTTKRVYLGDCGYWNEIEQPFVAVGAGAGMAYGYFHTSDAPNLDAMFEVVASINASVSEEYDVYEI